MTHDASTDLTLRLRELARISAAPGPLVSVYLNTRWADEHQRERVRVFLKNELRKARAGASDPGLASDLDWIEAQGTALTSQAEEPGADGVAFFACHALGLRERHPVRVPFEDTLVVARAPYLRPLAELVEGTPSTLIVFVDSESARLIPLTPEGGGEEVSLQSDVPGHHRQGGWALLAQSRYQRHIQAHRDQHFEAVVESLTRLIESDGIQRIVLAGETRAVAVFRPHLPPRLAARVIGAIPAARYEPAAALGARAAELVARVDVEEERAAGDAALTEAAKGGRAVASLEEALEAVGRGAVHRLFLLKGFREPGRLCTGCGALQRVDGPACRLCGRPTEPRELGEALVERVLATGGRVDVLETHDGLARVGGVAALLRYPL
jgi:peptide subunit release factor 1 (eRF1)